MLRRWGILVALAARPTPVLFLGALFIASFANAAAEPQDRELGDGLAYFRVHHLPADLPSDQAIKQRASVIDLRYVTADSASAKAFEGWLRFHASAKTPVFILLNGTTASSLRGALTDRDQFPGLVTIGVSAQTPAPDIAVTTTAESEKEAYEALDKGLTVEALTTDHPDKQRNDEASLARDHPVATSEPETSATAVKTKPASTPIDVALQRAIQLHRALRAMKKI